MPTGSVLARAVWPTAKVSHLGPTAATVTLAALPAVVTVGRGGTDVGTAIVVLVLGAGASLAWAVDDAGRDSLIAMPVSAPIRAAVRVLAAAVVAALVTGAGLGFVAAGPGLPSDLADRVPEGVAAAAVALAVAFGAARRGERTSGATGVGVGLLVPTAVAALAMRWPSAFPTFGAGALHSRWWLVAAAGVVVVMRCGRDPAR